MNKLRFCRYLIFFLMWTGCLSSCGIKNETDMPDMSNIDFSNIENLYEQPLPVIQKCVQGKWKWVAQFGGVIGISYPENTFIDIKDDHYVSDNGVDSQHTIYFTWKKYPIYHKGYETWVMWDNERDRGIWYFSSIKNDTLGVGYATGPEVTFQQFSNVFVRVK